MQQVVLYVSQMLVSDGELDYLTDNAEVLWQVPVAVGALTVFYAMLRVAVASLTTRRIVAGATLLGITLVTSAVAGILVEVAGGDRPGFDGSAAALINVLALPLQVRDLVFLGRLHETSDLSGVPGGGAMALAAYLVVVAVCTAVILRRYRTAEA